MRITPLPSPKSYTKPWKNKCSRFPPRRGFPQQRLVTASTGRGIECQGCCKFLVGIVINLFFINCTKATRNMNWNLELEEHSNNGSNRDSR